MSEGVDYVMDLRDKARTRRVEGKVNPISDRLKKIYERRMQQDPDRKSPVPQETFDHLVRYVDDDEKKKAKKKAAEMFATPTPKPKKKPKPSPTATPEDYEGRQILNRDLKKGGS